MKFSFSLTITVAVITLSCSKTPESVTDDDTNFNKAELVANLSTEYIVPSYEEYAKSITELNSAYYTFKANSSSVNFELFRSAYLESAEKWQMVAFLEFGPAANISLRAQSNIYPVDSAVINDNITNQNYNLGLPSNYVAKGLNALDYLLYGKNSLNGNLNFASEQNSLVYMGDIITELNTNIQTVLNDWKNGYAETFNSKYAGTGADNSISIVMNTISMHYESYVRKGKLGVPVGVFNGFSQMPMPEKCEAYYSKHSKTLLYLSVLRLQEFMSGDNPITENQSLSFMDYLDYVQAKSGNDDLSASIKNQFSQILIETSSIQQSLDEEIINNQGNVLSIYNEYQKLVPLIKVDMTSALGVIISYQDNDGD